MPAMVMLSAGLVDCVIGFVKHMALWDFTKQLLIVLVTFFVIGCIVRVVLSKAIDATADKEVSEEKTEKDEENQNTDETKEEE